MISSKQSLLALIFIWASFATSAQYSVNNTFGNLVDCDTMSRGIFIVWWDNDVNYATDVDVLLDSMLSIRNTCLNDLNMVDPPNPLAGDFYNVYIHTPGAANDIFAPYGWGNGQGTDPNGNPYLTLPNGVLSDWVNLGHETFHIFQYNSNSPGYAYSGNSQWYIEASANWFAAKQNPSAARTFVEAESLVRVPQVPLWLSYGNYPNSYPSNWQRYVHQYAMALWLYYLTEEAGVPGNLITEGFFNGTLELPQEYLFNQIGAQDHRQYFIDWAGHMTNDFDFITPLQAATNETEWNNYADPSDDNEFIQTYNNTGSGTWYQPADSMVTNAWSFNTYRLLNNSTDSYTFELNGNSAGTQGDASYFQGQLVVKNSVTGTSFHDLNMVNDQQGDLTLNLTPDDQEVYFIIASMPEVFGDSSPIFQLFPYEMRITKGTQVGIAEQEDPRARTEVARYNTLGQKLTDHVDGFQIVLYDDGSTKREFVKKN